MPVRTPTTDRDPPVAVGDVLGERYRIDATGPERWRATDLLLQRPVAIRVQRVGAGITVREMREVVARTSAVGDARFVRLLDFGVERRPRVAYLVAEWVEAPPLSRRVATGPLPTAEAVTMAADVAAALVAAEEHGVHHGQLDADRVFVLPDGTVRIADLGVATLGQAPTAGTPAGRDLAALRVLLRTALTRRPDHRVQALLRGLDEARTLPAAAALLAEEARFRRAPAAPPTHRRWPRLALHAGALALVVVVALVTWREGFHLGTVPTGPQAPDRGGAAAAPATATVPILALRVDSSPGLPAQHPAQALLAADHKPTTAWWTTTFPTATFSSTRDGVGLLCDLGSSRLVTAVTVDLTVPGATVAVYAGDSQSIGPGQGAPLARVTHATVAESIPVSAPPARYWLVWLTRLPAHGKGFADGVAELSFQP